MIEQLIFNTLYIEKEYQRDLKDMFKCFSKMESKLLLAINTYISYILHKRGVI